MPIYPSITYRHTTKHPRFSYHQKKTHLMFDNGIIVYSSTRNNLYLRTRVGLPHLDGLPAGEISFQIAAAGCRVYSQTPDNSHLYLPHAGCALIWHFQNERKRERLKPIKRERKKLQMIKKWINESGIDDWKRKRHWPLFFQISLR